MSIVKIINPNPSDWSGIRCFIGEREILVCSVNSQVAVDEIPVVELKIMYIPGIETECLEQDSVIFQLIIDAFEVLRHELLQHGEIYHGFKASLKTAIEKYCTCGLPFEPEEETAGKILDFMIGEEQKE